MIDFDTAQKLVLERLAKMERNMHDFGSALPDREHTPKLHLVISKAVEYEFGWVFFYDTKEYLETNSIDDSIVGNAPFIVDKNDGQLYVTGTTRPIEYFVDQYRKGVKTRA